MIFREHFALRNRSMKVSSFFLLAILIWLSMSIQASSVAQDRMPPPMPDAALEIVLPKGERLPRMTGGGLGFIHRRQLTIFDPITAGDFTAIEVWAKKESGGMSVKLSIIYNDLSKQEWWKEKKERLVGTYLVPYGQSIKPAELIQYGIEPFELKAFTTKPVSLRPGEEIRIINNTAALEVIGIEKSLDRYRLSFKNVSDKNIIAYYVTHGRGNRISRASHYGTRQPLIRAGEVIHRGGLFSAKDEPIIIRAVIFDDYTFEGDPQIGAGFVAQKEGVRLQAPSVLRVIEQTLAASDEDIEKAFIKLETDLWQIPEAIDKPSALALLKEKFPYYADEQLGRLYEELKGGLYNARNMALSPLGDLKRRHQERSKQAGEDSDTASDERRIIRLHLTHIKETFEEMIARLK